MIRMKRINWWPLIFLALALAFGAILIFGRGGKTFEIGGNLRGKEKVSETPSVDLSPFSGLPCANTSRRPVAVMLSGDAITRPLSGLAEADLVVNMPVITGSITRMMAVYVCESPKEIGSVRSARDDFLPLAQGMDAIFAHWGGSHFALEQLNKGVMDNLDALKDSGSIFYRKSGIESPHNGFTSFIRLWEASQKLDYRLTGEEAGYPHLAGELTPVATTTKTLTLGFSGSFQVKYEYNPADNSYRRWRGGTKEIDKNTGQQVVAKNVLVMKTTSQQIEGQYNDVQVTGQGEAIVYRNGEEVFGNWKKTSATGKLYFYDRAGKEIKLVPGQIWLEIIQTDQSVIYI